MHVHIHAHTHIRMQGVRPDGQPILEAPLPGEANIHTSIHIYTCAHTHAGCAT